jgi:hypothetical protein
MMTPRMVHVVTNLTPPGSECATLLAGHDECARINDEQRQVNLDFSNNVMKMVREQQARVGAPGRCQIGHMDLLAVKCQCLVRCQPSRCQMPDQQLPMPMTVSWCFDCKITW